MSSRSPSRRCRLLALLLALACCAPAFAGRSSAAFETPSHSPAGKVLLSRNEGLSLAFGEAKVQRSTVYLDETQRKAIAKLAKVDFDSGVIYSYRATKGGKWIGTAYFDTHRVRCLRETLMVVVKPDGSIGRVEVLSFAEPRDYLPRGVFYEQFSGRKLDSDLNLKRKIRCMTGATLSSQATTRCARRVLALHGYLEARKRRELEKKKALKKKDSRGGITKHAAPA
jgi:hypothetical protein